MLKNWMRKLVLCGVFCLTVVCFMLILPGRNVSAFDYELKTNAERTGKVVKEDAEEDGVIVSVVENANFRLTLKTDKAEYHAGDRVRLKTELEYIGSKDQLEMTFCKPMIAYKIEGSNGLKIAESVYWYKKDAKVTTFKKGDRIEEDFGIRRENIYCRQCDEEVINPDHIRNYIWDSESFDEFCLPQGTYTFFAVMTNELTKKKASTFYAEIHLNIDVDGDVFYDGSNLYRTRGEDEAVLIGTKADDKVGSMGFQIQSDDLIIPETVKYEGKKYTVTQIGDEGIRWFGFVDDYTYGYTDSGVLAGHNFDTVKIPSTVKVISRSAFLNAHINTLYINAGDLRIDEKAFSNVSIWGEENCSLEIKGGNVELGKDVFYYSCLEKINIHDCKSLIIGEQAFSNLFMLKSVKLPENTVSIGDRAFYESAERKDKVVLTIPKGTVNIDGPVANKMLVKVADGNTSFVERYGLLLTADGSTVLGIADFRVKNITMPEGVTTIKPYAFSATLIKKLVIPDTVTVIPEGMASMDNKLKYVTIGKGVTEIGRCAFWVTGVKKIKLPNGLKSIGDYAFSNCKLKKVTIPKSVESIGISAFEGNNISLKITFKKGNKHFKQVDNEIYIPGTKTVIGMLLSRSSDTTKELDYDKLDLQFVLRGRIYHLYIPETVKEVDISSFSASIMGEYYSGKYEVYEGAEVIFLGKEPPKFVDERNSSKEFFVYIFIPEDGDREAYIAALEEAGLEAGKNFRLMNGTYEDEFED
ncbi:MAG: leucine-rich repeat domain-containing protein [Lachnospiraceae bacterium]|nr:leucine-rich repeat domain-containing protein [Lachnospiraceae bacterium]